MKIKAFFYRCVSVAIVLLMSLSLFATHAFALSETGVEQLKNNYNSSNTSLDSVKVPEESLDTPQFSHQKSILPAQERLNSSEMKAKTQPKNNLKVGRTQVCSDCNCDNPTGVRCTNCCL
jgi:hypothetical protein